MPGHIRCTGTRKLLCNGGALKKGAVLRVSQKSSNVMIPYNLADMNYSTTVGAEADALAACVCCRALGEIHDPGAWLSVSQESQPSTPQQSNANYFVKSTGDIVKPNLTTVY